MPITFARCLEFFLGFLIFGAFGLGLEVIFTSILANIREKDQEKRRQLMGYSSLWYLPLYGILPPVGYYFAYPLLVGLPFYMRGLIYAPLFHFVEYLGMWILRLINGKSPSEDSYRQTKWSIHGLTRIDYAPAFFVMGLIFEQLYLRIIWTLL